MSAETGSLDKPANIVKSQEGQKNNVEEAKSWRFWRTNFRKEAEASKGWEEEARGSRRWGDKKIEEEKQELKGDLRNFEGVDYTQIKPPWIDAESGEVLDPEEVEVSMQKERDSFEKIKVKEEISEEELKQIKAGEKQVVIVKAGWVILRKSTGVLKCR